MKQPPGRLARRRLVVGDEKSPPKRIRIDVLEDLVRQLRRTLAAVAKDLGLSEDEVSPVELVDLEAGSGGTVWEQSTKSRDIPLPLAFAVDAVAAKSKGKPYRSILTEASRRSIDELTALCASYGARGIPIRVEDLSPEEDGRERSSVTHEELVLVPMALSPAVDGEGLVSDLVEMEEAEAVQGEWLLRFTADVQRIDARERKIWLRVDKAFKQVKPKLSEELFAAVDADDARWKRVEITAMASGISIDDITEILRVAPATAEVMIDATPINEAASAIQPLLAYLETLSRFQDGWDSYDGKKIARPVLDQAKKFLILAAADAKGRGWPFSHPFIAPVAQGTVLMEWEKEGSGRQDLFLALEFNGKQIGYVRMAGETTVEGAATVSEALDFVRWFRDEAERPAGGDSR